MAVIEKQKQVNGIVSPRTANSVIKRAFPSYYNNMQDVMNDSANSFNC